DENPREASSTKMSLPRVLRFLAVACRLPPAACRACRLLPAVFVERLHEVFGDRIGGAAFDLPALEHEDDLAVLHKRDLRRGGRIAREIAARALGRFRVLPGEDSRQVFRLWLR